MRGSRSWLLFAIISGAALAAVPCESQTAQPYSTPAPAQPQAQSQAAQRLTLTEAESIAIQNHPQIQAADAIGFGRRRAG